MRFATCLLILLLGLASCQVAPPSQQSKLDAGFRQYTQRKFDVSEQAADAYIKKYPRDPDVDEAYYLRGISRLGRDNQQGASEDLLAAIKKSDRNDLKAKAYRGLGDIAFDQDQWAKAVEYYRASVKLLPTEAYAPVMIYRTGAALQAQGKWADSRPYFQQVIQSNCEQFWKDRAAVRLRAEFYSLQFGAYRDASNASQAAHVLRRQKIDPYVINEVRDGQLMFFVRYGKFKTYDAADDARTKLLTQNPLVTIVP